MKNLELLVEIFLLYYFCLYLFFQNQDTFEKSKNYLNDLSNAIINGLILYFFIILEFKKQSEFRIDTYKKKLVIYFYFY